MNAFASNKEISSLKITEKVKTIDKSKSYAMRLYIFTNLNVCKVINANIPEILKKTSNRNIETVVILNSLSQDDAEILKKENKWETRVIGDIDGIYTEYYKIKYSPAALILDSDGIVIDFGKLGSDININTIKNLSVFKELKNVSLKTTSFNNLTEIKRIIVKDKELPLTSGKNYRELLFDTLSKKYFLRNNRSPNILIIDSNGAIIKTINKEKYPALKGYNSCPGLSFGKNNSSIFIYDLSKKYKNYFQYYDIKNDSLTKSKEFVPFLIDSNTRHSQNYIYNAEKEYFVTFYTRKTLAKQSYLDSNYQTAFVYDTSNKLLKMFDKPDEVYIKNKVSKWFHHNATIDENNNLITLQGFSNKLKFWDSNFNLVKVNNLDMGKEFRKVDFDIKDSLTRKDAAEVNSKITRTWYLLYDKVNKNSLVCYFNETYPEGVIDNSSDEILTERYLIISDSNGKRLSSAPIKISKFGIPFLFENNILYMSELDNNQRLQIAIYKFTPN